ncbi:MAG TPA: hypothetical protein VK453_00690 [Micromonosporaceae bacterium]|nr:hypothetical protein [Micromonosporaceae bacterium]
MGSFDVSAPTDEEPGGSAAARPDDRAVLPEQSADDTDAGWGEASTGNDERLLADRPPHWG